MVVDAKSIPCPYTSRNIDIFSGENQRVNFTDTIELPKQSTKPTTEILLS